MSEQDNDSHEQTRTVLTVWNSERLQKVERHISDLYSCEIRNIAFQAFCWLAILCLAIDFVWGVFGSALMWSLADQYLRRRMVDA